MRHGFAKHDRITHALGASQLVLGFGFVIFGDVSRLGFGLLLVVLGGASIMRPTRDRSMYNAGWVSGRAAFVLSMCEAQQRGMRPHEWLIAEAERDGFAVEVVEVVEGERDE